MKTELSTLIPVFALCLFGASANALDLGAQKAAIAESVAREVADPILARDITEIRFAKEVLDKLPYDEREIYLKESQSYLTNRFAENGQNDKSENPADSTVLNEHHSSEGQHEEHSSESDSKSNVLLFGMKRIYTPGADRSLTGSEIAVEQVLIPDYLEVQYGISKNNDPDNPAVGLDIAFKVPFEISETSAFKLGYGTTHSYQKNLDFGNHNVSAEFQHWFSPNYGWYLGVSRGLTIDKSSEVSSGLLINLDRK